MTKKNFDQKVKRTKKLHKAIKINLKRRTIIVDDKLVHHKNVPIPSWIELSIIDVCNRSCSFCPKADPKVAPKYSQSGRKVIPRVTPKCPQRGAQSDPAMMLK